MGEFILTLLNPHGSDETDKPIVTTYALKELLNPHGSDETHSTGRDKYRARKLLNPHGSDETVLMNLEIFTIIVTS